MVVSDKKKGHYIMTTCTRQQIEQLVIDYGRAKEIFGEYSSFDNAKAAYEARQKLLKAIDCLLEKIDEQGAK